MSTHIEWAEAAISGAAYVPAADVNSWAEGDDLPVLVLGVLGDTVMAFSGSKDEIVKLLLDALNAVGADEALPALLANLD